MTAFDDSETRRANIAFIKRSMETPLLSREHEYALARAWRNDNNDRALHELINAYNRLVVSTAGRFRNYGLPMGDLIQEGVVGLLHAANRFEPDRDVRFSTYASWWIRSAMQDFILRNWSIVRTGTTASQKSLFFNLRRLRSKIEEKTGEQLNQDGREEIAETLGVPLRDVEAMEGRLSGADGSLNAVVGEDGDQEWQNMLSDERPTPEDNTILDHDSLVRRDWLEEALDNLGEREAKIIRMRRLTEDGVTLEELTGLGDAIKTSAVQYFTSEGIFIAEEKVGVKAATTHPQLSAHRAKFHSTLVRKVQVLLGNERVHLDCALTDVQQHGEEATVHIIRTSTKEVLPPVTCDFIVGCDGLKSAVRSALYGQIQPRHTGKTLFRGICEIDRLNGDGRTVVQCGDENISFICYPISEALRKEGKFLCNWAMNVAREHPGAQENWENRTSIEHIRDELDTLSGNTFGGLLSQHAVSLFGCLSVLMSYVSVVAVCCYITAVSRCGCLGVLSSRAVCIMVLFDSRCLYCGVA